MDSNSHDQAERIDQISTAAGRIEKVTPDSVELAQQSAAGQQLGTQATAVYGIAAELDNDGRKVGPGAHPAP